MRVLTGCRFVDGRNRDCDALVLDEGSTGGEWLRGYGYDESAFAQAKRPSRADLDRIAPERPAVIFRRDCHSYVVNTAVSPQCRIPERHFTMLPPMEGLKKTLADMQKEKNTVIVLLSHLGLEKDREIASLFPGVSVIIDGHSHLRLDTPEKSGSTLIVHGGAFGEYLGILDLDLGTTITLRHK